MLPGVSGRERGRWWWWSVVLAFVLGAALAHIAFVYEPYSFLIGDCPYYAQTAISLLTDHDLDLRNQLKRGLAVHKGNISLGARDEWYPKHPVLMPLATVPLVPLFGMNAFLIFNVLILAALGVAMFELACLSVSRAAAAIGTLETMLGSFLILYDYNYSPDLFACLLLTLSIIAAIRGRSLSSGLLAGLAGFARTSNIFLLPILLGYTIWKSRLRGAVLFLAAAALPLAAQAGLNSAMFGSPFASPYSRIIMLEGDQVVLHSHMADFDNPIWDGIRGQLLDREKGLLFTAPVLLLAVPGYVLWFGRDGDKALLCLGVGEFLFLIFSRYRWWPTSHVGNRFLMPLVALSTPAIAFTAEWMLDRMRRPPAG